MNRVTIMIGCRLWLGSHCRLVLEPRFIIAAQSLERVSVMVAIVYGFGIEAKRRCKILGCSIYFVLRHQNAGEVVVRFRGTGFEAERNVVLFHRFIQAARLLQSDAVVQMLARAKRQIGHDPTLTLRFRPWTARLANPERTERNNKHRRPL